MKASWLLVPSDQAPVFVIVALLLVVTCSLLSVLIGSSSSQGNPNPEPTNSLVDSDLEAALPSAAVTPLSEPPLVISQLRDLSQNGESISS